MKNRRVVHSMVLFLMLPWMALPLFGQGMYWESTTTARERASERSRVAKFYYMPRMYKAVDDDGMIVIIRLDRERMYMIDVNKKTYHDMTFTEMETMMKGAGKQLDAAMEQMKEQMASLPEEQRKMVEQMMGKKAGKPDMSVDVSKTGETRTISGFKCVKYVLKGGESDLATVWATRDIDGFTAMSGDMKEFGERMSKMMPGQKDVVKAAINALDGFPIQTETRNGMTMTVTKVEKRNTPAGEFEVPSGFTKEEMPTMDDVDE